VSEHQGQLRMRKLAVDDVEIGAADTARLDLKTQLPRPGLGLRHVGFAKRFSGRMQNLCAHGS
jgi:hypothetical protein